MESGSGNIRRTVSVALGLTASLLLVASAWSFVALVRALSAEASSVRREVRLSGRELERRLALRRFAPPDGSEVLKPDRDPDTSVFLRQVALFSAGGTVWVVPPAELPRFDRRTLDEESVTRAGDLWVFTRRYVDGRTLAAFFEAPAYERTRDGFLLLAVYGASTVIALLCFWALIAWKVHRAYTGIAGTLREAGRFLPSDPDLTSAQAMTFAIRDTVAELKRSKDQLDGLLRAEKQRAEDVEDLAKALCANLEAGYMRFDGEGRFIEGNMEARRLLGLVEFPRAGDRDARLLASRPSLLEILAESREARGLCTREEVAGAPGLLLQVAAIPLANQLGQTKGHLLILRDRSEAYAMARALRERDSLTRLGEVAAGVAHEVRNALGSMTATLRLLREDHPTLGGDDRFRIFTEEIRGLERAVRDLLDYARPHPPDRREIPAVELLEDLALQLRDTFPGVEVEVGAPEGKTLSADRDALHRALLNLARNAAEAALSGARRPARVRLEAEPRPGGGALLRVMDSGPGIPREAGDIFEPFVSQKPGGTGLGLAIARKLTREHGGELTASRDPGPLGGACFELLLPPVP